MKKKKNKGRFLTLVLRHKPEALGLSLDDNGWVDIEELIAAFERNQQTFSREELEKIVRDDNKQRFAISECGKRVRANQGHSVDVDLDLAPSTPPEWLYHGTVGKFLKSIQQEGLIKGSRHHVHLSADRDTAISVGGRRGSPVILAIRSGDMARHGFTFFQSHNGVWLTEHVPPEFINS